MRFHPNVAAIGMVMLSIFQSASLAMDKTQLVVAMSSQAALTRADARKALDAYIVAVANTLKKGGKVTLVGFGEFSVDTSSGVATVRFEAGQDLREAVALLAPGAPNTAAQACTYSLSRLSQSVSASRASGCVSVSSGGACAWQASSDSAWLAVTSGAAQTGGGTVCFEAQPNAQREKRSGRISIGDRVFVVSQHGRGGGAAAEGKPKPQ
jgi:DNA-binding protein HU-beta